MNFCWREVGWETGVPQGAAPNGTQCVPVATQSDPGGERVGPRSRGAGVWVFVCFGEVAVRLRDGQAYHTMLAFFFDLEDYANTYRATRDAYLKASS